MTELDRLIEKHSRSGLLVDSNLLLLLLVGRTEPERVELFKRTKDRLNRGDYDLLETFVERFSRVLTTAHILTEVSNLGALKGEVLSRFRSAMSSGIALMDELHRDSKSVSAHSAFKRLGLADAAIMTLCSKTLVLTDDAALFVSLHGEGIDAINFNHIRIANRMVPAR